MDVVLECGVRTIRDCMTTVVDYTPPLILGVRTIR